MEEYQSCRSLKLARIIASCALAPDLFEMPLSLSTVADLRRAGIITSTEIVAAVKRYMYDPALDPYRFASGHTIDVAAAVAASAKAFGFQNRRGPHEKVLRSAIATIIMAAPVTLPRATR